jgi:hypothetical protein
MPYAPTTPVWNTPNLFNAFEQVDHGSYDDLVNDVCAVYAKPWMRYVLSAGGNVVGVAVNEGQVVFTNANSATYNMVQNSPLSGVGSYSVTTGGVFSLPSGVPGIYRVRAMIYSITPSTTSGYHARAAVGWVNGGGLYATDLGSWVGDNIVASSGGQYFGCCQIESLFPGNSTPYGDCTAFEIFLASDRATRSCLSSDPNGALNPVSSPPGYFTWVEAIWLGSDGTF